MADISKDWATYDQERGAGEKTGRFAGTLAGVAGAAKVGRMAFRRLGRAGVRRVPAKVALAGVAAYGTYQGVKQAAGYVGRKIDDAVGRVAKDWSSYDQNRKPEGHPVRGAAAGLVGANVGFNAGAMAGVYGGKRAAVAGQKMAGKGKNAAAARRHAAAQHLADHPGTPGEGAAAKAAADRMKAQMGRATIGNRIGARLARVHAGKAGMVAALAGGLAGAYGGHWLGKGLFSGGDTPLGSFLNPNKVKARGAMAPGMLQGRTKAFAGPNRALGGPDVAKGYAFERAVTIIKGSVEQTMHEFKHGKLHSGSKHGPRVSNRKQAIAIALSQAGLSRG